MRKNIQRVLTLTLAALLLTAVMAPAALAAGWEQEGNDWRYADSTGAYLRGWQQIGGVWYLFTPGGIMTRGWQYDGAWYYMDPSSGAMRTGWQQISGKWYHFASSGAMQTGWIRSNGLWYYMTDTGAMQTGWLEDGGEKYYMDASGAMRTGWCNVEGGMYFFGTDGAMQTGWVENNGKRYYMDPETGRMCSGWRLVDGKWYFLHKNISDSYMLTNAVLKENGKYAFLGADGVMAEGSFDYEGVTLPVSTAGYITAAEAQAILGDAFAAFDAAAVDVAMMVAQVDVKYPYYIEVNKGAQIVTVYTYGADGKYTVPAKYILCSTGREPHMTPEGLFAIPIQYRWRAMGGGVFAQYASRIVDRILFHAIPSKLKDPSTVFTKYYNVIGTPASAGCVRLLASEAKWIYENCPVGTLVRIYTGEPDPELHASLLPERIYDGSTYLTDPSDPAGANIAPPGSWVRNTPCPGVVPLPTPRP